MDSSFDSSCSLLSCDDTAFTLKKPVLPELVDETSRDSGIGHDDDVTAEGALSTQPELDTNARSPLVYSPIKSAVRLNFRSLRSLSFDSPSNGSSLALPDFSPLEDESVTLLANNVTFNYSHASTTTPVLSDQFDTFGLQNQPNRKRPSPICDVDDTTPFIKRRCGMGRFKRFHSLDLVEDESNNKANTIDISAELTSNNDELIKDTLDRVSDDANLISDGTKACCLPTIPGRHQDLKSITPETLAKVLNKGYDDVIGNHVFVDCRYPYEFEGGHIKGAVNYYTRELIKKNLVNTPLHSEDPAKRTVLIFHCEFSSERGPKLSRFLRAMDREQNKDSYPFLFYPEIYLLHGGYKDFFGTEMELCEPQTYVPMLKDGYKEDLRKFRVKSKSWAGEKQRSSLRRGLKF